MLLFSDALQPAGSGGEGIVVEELQKHRSLQERFIGARARLCCAHAGAPPRLLNPSQR